MRTIVVIPTKGLSPFLVPLVRGLAWDHGIHHIQILNNSNIDLEFTKDLGLENSQLPLISVQNMWNYSIYGMWNYVWEREKKIGGEFNIAFLNDDIELSPYSIYTMARILRAQDDLAIVYPDVAAGPPVSLFNKEYPITYTETTGGAGGMTGFCFMLKGELDIPYIDENLKLYWGDDDLVAQTIKQGYKIGQIGGLPILHAGSFTIRQMDNIERLKLMESDRQYFNTKYGQNRSPVGV